MRNAFISIEDYRSEGGIPSVSITTILYEHISHTFIRQYRSLM